jgi:hypothetical protein
MRHSRIEQDRREHAGRSTPLASRFAISNERFQHRSACRWERAHSAVERLDLVGPVVVAVLAVGSVLKVELDSLACLESYIPRLR